MTLTENNKEAFYALVRAGLWEQDVRLSLFGEVDYKVIYRLAKEQSVIGLTTAGLEHVKDVKVPQEVVLQFVSSTLQLEQKNKSMNQFIKELVSMLRKNNIYVLLVKGQGVAQSYEKPLWRTCGDVDLFLSDVDYENAKVLLSPMASFIEQESVEVKHLGMNIEGWVVELHGSLRVGLPNRINNVLDDICRDTSYSGNVRSWNNNGVQVFMLGKENDVFYVFVHFFNHFYKGGIGLRQICDWCRLLWTFRSELNVQVLEERVKKAGLMTEWKAFGAYAVEYLGLSPDAVPFYSDAHYWKRKAKRINKFILMAGNFGHNRDMSYFSKYPYLIRKCCSMWMRVRDLFNHARIFPLDSLRFFPRIMFNGVRSAVKGE